MPQLYYLPDEQSIETLPTDTILQAALRAGIAHAHACGGNARCSTCRVVVLEGLEHCVPRNAQEQALAQRLHFSGTIRLACQTTITGDVSLRRPVVDEVDVALVSQIQPGAEREHVGEEKQMAILFSDISGYTPFVEHLPPYDVTHVLNRYFYLMGEVIERHGGYISDYIGDGLMVLFGLEDATDVAHRAVKTGLEMFEALDRLNPYLEAMYSKSFQIRIGVHVGDVVVGTIGTPQRKKLAAIGDAVNMASRIETMNKEVGSKFLISEDTYRQLQHQVRVHRQVRVPLKGKTGDYTLYEVIGLDEIH